MKAILQALVLCFLVMGSLHAENAAVKVSAETNSFAVVTARLDTGGNLFLYLSTEKWLKGLSERLAPLKTLLSANFAQAGGNLEGLDKVFAFLTQCIRNSGIEDMSGVGISSIAREPGYYHNKVFLHHYPGKGAGYLWNVFGKSPHALSGLDMLPENTVLACFGDCDLAGLWKAIESQAADSGIPQLQEIARALPMAFEQNTKLSLEKLLGSYQGEAGLLVTLNPARMIELPVQGSVTVKFPEPAVALVLKMSDDYLFDQIESQLKQNVPLDSADEAGLKLRSFQLPVPIPITLRPTFARYGDYFVLASTDTLVQDIVAAKSGKKPGLRKTEEFARLSKDITLTGNNFTYMSPRLTETLNAVLQTVARQAGNRPFPLAFKPSYSFTVMSHGNDGWFSISNGTQDGTELVILPAAPMVGLLAAIAIPNFIKARETAQRNACLANLRQIQSAKQQWALENKKASTDQPTDADLFGPSRYIQSRPACPAGGIYTIGKVGDKPTCSHPNHSY